MTGRWLQLRVLARSVPYVLAPIAPYWPAVRRIVLGSVGLAYAVLLVSDLGWLGVELVAAAALLGGWAAWVDHRIAKLRRDVDWLMRRTRSELRQLDQSVVDDETLDRLLGQMASLRRSAGQ